MVKQRILGCLILFVVGAGLVVGAYFAGNAFGRKYSAEIVKQDAPAADTPSDTENLSTVPEKTLPRAGRNIVLYLPDEKEGEAAVKAANRDIPENMTTDKLTQSMIFLVEKLVKDGVLPQGTRLVNKVKVKGGVAYLDFSDDIKKFSGSTLEEAQLLNSLASTAYANNDEVKKISVLVGGSKIETLGGHMDLSEPFAPDVQ